MVEDAGILLVRHRLQKIQKLVSEIVNDDLTSPMALAEVSLSPLKRFDQKDALPTPTSQVTPEFNPASSTKGDITGYNDDDDTVSVGSDASSENSYFLDSDQCRHIYQSRILFQMVSLFFCFQSIPGALNGGVEATCE